MCPFQATAAGRRRRRGAPSQRALGEQRHHDAFDLSQKFLITLHLSHRPGLSSGKPAQLPSQWQTVTQMTRMTPPARRVRDSDSELLLTGTHPTEQHRLVRLRTAIMASIWFNVPQQPGSFRAGAQPEGPGASVNFARPSASTVISRHSLGPVRPML